MAQTLGDVALSGLKKSKVPTETPVLPSRPFPPVASSPAKAPVKAYGGSDVQRLTGGGGTIEIENEPYGFGWRQVGSTKWEPASTRPKDAIVKPKM